MLCNEFIEYVLLNVLCSFVQQNVDKWLKHTWLFFYLMPASFLFSKTQIFVLNDGGNSSFTTMHWYSGSRSNGWSFLIQDAHRAVDSTYTRREACQCLQNRGNQFHPSWKYTKNIISEIPCHLPSLEDWSELICLRPFVEAHQAFEKSVTTT